MDLKILQIDETQNGGAIVVIEADEEFRLFLIEKGFNAVLKEALDNFNEKMTKEMDEKALEEWLLEDEIVRAQPKKKKAKKGKK